MLTPQTIDDLIAEVARSNALSLEEAARIVVEVGDTPEIDETGKVVVDGRAFVWPGDSLT